MNLLNENARKWLDALRSGEYRQTRSKLKRLVNGEFQYCCLGVACELYIEDTGGGHWESSARNSQTFVDSRGNKSGEYLTDRAAAWLGVKHNASIELAGLNDNGADFSTIAKYIEVHAHDLVA